MQLDSAQLSRFFPWLKQLWLLGPAGLRDAQPPDLDLLVVSTVPSREVLPGQRQRLLAELQEGSDRRLDLRLTTSAQLASWLARGGRFATTFRRRAVKLFERPADTPRQEHPHALDRDRAP